MGGKPSRIARKRLRSHPSEHAASARKQFAAAAEPTVSASKTSEIVDDLAV
jgi:hypothetical protein